MSTSSSQDAGGTGGEYAAAAAAAAAAAGAEPERKVGPEVAESSTNDGKKPYEEERRILLDGVAESLERVVRKMKQVNVQLGTLTDSCQEVQEVASVWREALAEGDGDNDPETEMRS